MRPERTLAAIMASPGVALLLGGSDTGKTTWVRHAAMSLGRQGCLPLALVDTDIGQASLGPPATVALRIFRHVPSEGSARGCFDCDALSFVGSVSPMGHALQLVVATKRLVGLAQQAGARIVLVDTTGLIAPGFGFQVKLRKIELVAPAHLVVFQRQAELEPLLSVVSKRTGLQVHRLTVSESVRPRTPAERSAYRAGRFADYFAKACPLTLDTAKVLILPSPFRRHAVDSAGVDIVRATALRREDLGGLLMGLNNAEDTALGLARLQGVSEDGREICVRTPVEDASEVRILQLGSMRLNESGRAL